jgi:hypothetical protein
MFWAGFTDPDGDKLLGGTVPPTVDANGVVTSIGYTIPNQTTLLQLLLYSHLYLISQQPANWKMQIFQ